MYSSENLFPRKLISRKIRPPLRRDNVFRDEAFRSRGKHMPCHIEYATGIAKDRWCITKHYIAGSAAVNICLCKLYKILRYVRLGCIIMLTHIDGVAVAGIVDNRQLHGFV